MTYLFTVPILIVIYLSSCSRSTSNQELIPLQTGSLDKKSRFEEYLTGLGKIHLPLEFKCSINENDIIDGSPRSLYGVDREFSDGNHYVYGKLISNKKYVIILYGIVTDDVFPILVTYDEKGKIIDQLSLVQNLCGAPSDDMVISSGGRISEDLRISISETISYYHRTESTNVMVIDSTSIIQKSFIIDSLGYCIKVE